MHVVDSIPSTTRLWTGVVDRVGVRWLVSLGLVLLTALAYWNLAANEFIAYDDPEFVTGATFVQRGFSWEGLQWAFTTTNTGNYIPLTWLSHMLDCQLFGLDPAWHHRVNWLLHATNVVLLFWVLSRLSGSVGASAAVAALFAVHPLNVESVAWVAQRRNVLSTLFWLLAMAAYGGYVRHRDWPRYGLIVACLVLGLASKPMLVTLPVALLLLDYWPLRRLPGPDHDPDETAPPREPWLRVVAEKLPLLALALAWSWLVMRAQDIARVSWGDWPLSSRLANAVVCYVAYLRKAIWPIDLAVLYPLHPAGAPGWQVILALLVLVAISLVLLWPLRERRYLTVGWLWFLVTLAPVSGIIQVGLQSMADRYAYIPLWGIFIIAVWGLSEATEAMPNRRTALALGLAAGLLFFSVATMLYVARWRDTETLFRWALGVDQDNSVAHVHVGRALIEKGKENYPRALRHLNRARQLEPDEFDIYCELGDLALLEENRDQALEHYRQALTLNPVSVRALLGVGRIHLLRGQLDQAAENVRAAVRIERDNLTAQYLMGMVYLAQRRPELAVEHFEEAIRFHPADADSHRRLAEALVALEHRQRAEAELARVLELAPDDAAAHYQLGALDQQAGRLSQAMARYNRALELDAEQLGAANNLAWILATHPDARLRDGRRAVELASGVCQRSGRQQPTYLDTLSAAYAEIGDFENAVQAARSAANRAIAAGRTELAAQIVSRQRLYEAGQAFRDQRLQ